MRRLALLGLVGFVGLGIGMRFKVLGVLAGQSNRLLRNPALFGRVSRRDFSSRVRVAGRVGQSGRVAGMDWGAAVLGEKRDCPWAAAV